MHRILGVLVMVMAMALAACCPPERQGTVTRESAGHADQPACDQATREACDTLRAEAEAACQASCDDCVATVSIAEPPLFEVVCELIEEASAENTWRGTCSLAYTCECGRPE